ncbi:hypothetical protein AbraCBS73388_007900, partial [Aspergillus brasiliensis]
MSTHVLKSFSLKGKTALVTGASRGIGLEVARGLAEAGANIAIVYRSSQKAGEDAAREIQESYGVKALAYQAEVGDAAAIDSVVGRVTKEFGGLDIAVINAGVSECFDALGCEPDKYREQMAVNLDGAFYSAQAAAKVFQSQGKGNIIFTTSISAVIVNTPQNQSIYNASKAGLLHLARSLAVEWVDFCRINCISPGYIETEMVQYDPEEWKREWIKDTPFHRFGKPEELKGAYVFCASAASSFMTGAHIVVDGGFTL